VTTPAEAAPSRSLGAAAQPAKFLIVGAGGYVVNLGVFALLHEVGVTYVVNSIVSYFIANALMYVGNRYFTFRLGHPGFWSAYLRYMIVGAVVAGLNAAILAALVQGTGIDSRIGVAISLLLITPVAFVLFKRWTFRIDREGSAVQVAADGAG
jgi:putative flippase GtrA